MKGARATPRLVFGPSVTPGERVLPEEVAVAPQELRKGDTTSTDRKSVV